MNKNGMNKLDDLIENPAGQYGIGHGKVKEYAIPYYSKEQLESLRPYIKTERDELLEQLGVLSMKTDLWANFTEQDYDRGCELMDKIKEIEK